MQLLPEHMATPALEATAVSAVSDRSSEPILHGPSEIVRSLHTEGTAPLPAMSAVELLIVPRSQQFGTQL
jgi:hypothetical protein